MVILWGLSGVMFRLKRLLLGIVRVVGRRVVMVNRLDRVNCMLEMDLRGDMMMKIMIVVVLSLEVF